MGEIRMFGDILSAGASIIGGLINRGSADEANRINAANAARQEQLQRDFAQQGIQWKVADAKAAGVHPLYALGANTVSYSPVSLGHSADTSLGTSVANAGQSIGRAADAAATSDQRGSRTAQMITALQLERGSLENELLRSQIAKTRAQLGPPMPALTDKNAITGQPATRDLTLITGMPQSTPANESTQDAVSKEYGDEGIPQLPGQYRFIRDWIMSGRKQNMSIWGGAPLIGRHRWPTRASGSYSRSGSQSSRQYRQR